MQKIVLFISVALMLSSTIVTVHARVQAILNESSIDRAVAGIQRAAAAGVDVSALTDKFNLGLDILRQSQDYEFRSCSHNEDCQALVNEIFVSVAQESAILVEQSEAASSYHRIMTYGVFVPFVAFAASLSLVCLFKIWRSYQIKKFLDMEISEKKD